MSQPVKVSDALLLDARVAGEAVERSIAGQIEFWAKIGRALEPILRGDHVLALCRSGKVKPLSTCLATVDSPIGRQRLAEFEKSVKHHQGRPVYCRDEIFSALFRTIRRLRAHLNTVLAW